MAHWTQQIAEAYRALQEAERLKGRAAAAKQAELAKQGNPNAVKAILRQEKVGTMTVPKDRNRKPNEGLSNYSFEKMLKRLANPGFANPSVTQQKAADHKKQAQEKKDKLQAQDGFRTRESVVREITAELAAEKPKRTAAPMNETYRITPVRRDLLNKIEGTAMRDAKDAMGPDGEDFRASSLKKSDRAMSRISRIQMIKMMGKPSDKRTHDEHPMHRYFPDDRAPNQLTDRALKADLTAERKREISNRPKKKKMK
jgi:hypothetical protein